MKKIIGVLGIFLLAWCASYIQQNDVPRKAWAGITCTLPVILQNNTVADATQVMANFNQLAGCFTNVATVSQVTCGPGLDGGTITSIGTCSLSVARRTNPTVTTIVNGTGTYTTPVNVVWIEVKMVGGGGGGGGFGSAGGNGGNTTFSTAAANGGGGGPNNGTSGGGVGGTATGCTFGIPGSMGGTGLIGSDSVYNGTGGFGAAGWWGGGVTTAQATAGSVIGTNAPNNTGSGGSGFSRVAVGTGFSGSGGGAGGYCYLLIGNPAATYTFTVGAGGTAGTAGGIAAGGTGGTGVIYVIEHYN